MDGRGVAVVWMAVLPLTMTGCLTELWNETGDICPGLSARSDGEAVVPPLRYAVPVEWSAISTGLSVHRSAFGLQYEIEVVEGETGSTIPVELELVADDRGAWSSERQELMLRPGAGVIERSIGTHREERSCDDAPCVDWFELRVTQPMTDARATVRVAWHATFSAFPTGENWARPGATVELFASEPP